MLNLLTVKNFALLKDMELELFPGFTAITGETGAGKSLLAGAIAFLVGGKPNFAMVRDGSRFAMVEGEFALGSAEPILLRREITADGRTRVFYQDSPIRLKELLEIAQPLVDITSQRAFSHLLEPAYHLDFLDRWGNLTAAREQMERFDNGFRTLQREIADAVETRERFKRERELHEFQKKEIDVVAPLPGEDELLENELNRLEHLEEIVQTANELEELFTGDERSIDQLMVEADRRLNQLARIDRGLAELPSELSSARSIVKEINRRVAERTRQVEFDPGQLEEMRQRLHQLAALSRKYGGTLDSVIAKREEIETALAAFDRSEETIAELNHSSERLVSEWCAAALELGNDRKVAAGNLALKVVEGLDALGMPQARFEVRLSRTPASDGLLQDGGSRYRLDKTGGEIVEFFLSANPGMAPRPIEQVASGGELSRVLLALKAALPVSTSEPLTLFDEIDAGVSGHVAQLVGNKLKQLSGNRQLLAITHLPQIAALADHHLAVVKQSRGGTDTETTVVPLDQSQREREIASLLSDGRITDAALTQARHLMGK